ncbi:MAG: DEAD/DEAH box helicase family protein [Desulfobacterales bacterium]|nr:DEAD/DEAH box helicase family protein [Desulfobacterales bacterium]
MINRFSSRYKRLDQTFLNEKLKNARSYDRIAGFFSSSILEIAGETIEKISGQVRLICNSCLNKEDVITATSAQNAMRKEWCSSSPEEVYSNSSPRLMKFYELIKKDKLVVRVLPNDVFGLIHGKAGVITLADGKKTSFIGSVNETLSAWRFNYEILWEDDSPEAVKWVQEEFNFFWNSPYAIPLSDFVVEDIKRISEREVIDDIKLWKKEPDPSPAVIESPVYRQELGLWEHQKYFVNLAFFEHQKTYGARYVLADQVGLGKTIQLALSAQLMALLGNKPLLIIVPKTLIWQWQDEMINLLDMPSAVWTGSQWVDENEIKYPTTDDITKCPRRVGIISQGLIVNGREELKSQLLNMEFECVIVDEAHRARRENLGNGKENHKPQPNNLMEFLLEISKKTKSMLLATATPVQMYPIECWDLLYILSQKNDSVLGNNFSKWRSEPKKALDLIIGIESLNESGKGLLEEWEWLRNPFPPATEDIVTFGTLRKNLKMADDEFVIKPEILNKIEGRPEMRRIGRIMEHGFMQNHNPFIRHIVRRTRDFLENKNNYETGEPYLKKIEVVLMGENDNEALSLPPYLEQAYEEAEEFCTLLNSRVHSGGFIKTLLLKRVGSTMIAGKSTAKKMINWGILPIDEFDEDEDDDDYNDDNKKKRRSNSGESDYSELKNLTEEERECLRRFIKTLETNKEKDPKYELALDLLINKSFAEKGCIIFSQYFDSAYWIAENLSNDIKGITIGLYAGGDKSGIIREGRYQKRTKEDIKKMIKLREIKILVGTDAASEGLNLQTLGALINLDLPWNPTRLEQRKGRIQRIGQANDKVYIYNMRYKGSVEDRVHAMLSVRLKNISNIFGQLPDILEDVWVQVALNNRAEAEKIIDAIPKQHPFELKYEKQAIGHVDWESCTKVLNKRKKRKCLIEGWK